MEALKIKAETRLVELEQESYPVYCIESPKNKPQKPVFTALIDEFIKYQQGIGRAESSLERHQTCLKYFTDYLDEKKVSNLAGVTPQVVAGYQAWIYARKTRYGRPFALKSQIIILNALQVFFKYLLKKGHILNNPAEHMQLPKEPKKLPGKILIPKEMKKLLRQPDTSTVLGFRDRTIYEVLYSCGLRVSELIGMRVQDLDLNERTIFIPQSKHFKDRYTPLGETACCYLQEYMERIRPLLLRNSADSARDIIFLSRLGRSLDKSGVAEKLRIYGKRAGIKKHLTIHIFRHTLATEMLKSGADLRQIQELLGHKNLRTTQIYTHVVKGELKRVQAHCHPREQIDLPENFVKYRGRDYITADEKKKEQRNRS